MTNDRLPKDKMSEHAQKGKAERHLRVRVTKQSLQDATGRSLRPSRWAWLPFTRYVRVQVEPWEDGRSDSLFYAPFSEGLPSTSPPSTQIRSHPTVTNDSQSPFGVLENTEGTASHILPRNPESIKGHTYTTVDFVDVVPDQVDIAHLVDPSEDFEISFVGMVIPPFDGSSRNPNELLLYSVQSQHSSLEDDNSHDDDARGHSGDTTVTDTVNRTDRAPSSEICGGAISSREKRHLRRHKLSSDDLHSQRVRTTMKLSSKRVESALNPMTTVLQGQSNVGLSSSEIPKIHYDPDSDGRQAGSIPDIFVSIPATKSLYVQNIGTATRSQGNLYRSERDDVTGNTDRETNIEAEEERLLESKRTVSIRFTVMEIDRITNAQATALTNATELGSVISASSPAIPYANIISWAFSFASSVGEQRLKMYARPDFVMSTDVIFRLVKKGDDGSVTDSEGRHIRFAGPYLRVS